MSSDKRETNATGQPDHDVKYVLSGQPTGWAAMAKEVRDFDEEKVRSCKEDIDTLLVFAGLFSAVLSAFLIAEYPSLQPDRTAMMMYTLERIASQTAGYNLADGKLVAINILPATLTPFQPSASDIRVNILWFSSLLLSLITASFGMLVKQWLREFLAVEVPSPQARLRLRHLREPQVKGWKVYEIAATLPLLLQLALALFFVGLCFFTKSIHSSVEYTTLPLVVAWALFFFAVTLLPLFFPLCPYKTTLLKTVFAGVHHALTSMAGYKWAIFIPSKLSIPDELMVVNNGDEDIDILLSVDAIQASDELLGTTIAEALQYLRPGWKQVAVFVFEALSRRSETISVTSSEMMQSSGVWLFRTPNPLMLLRPQTRDAIIEILYKGVNGLREPYTGRLVAQSWRLGQVTVEENRDTMLFYVFSIIMSSITPTSASLTPPDVLAFLGFYLTHEQYGPAICRDLLQCIYLPDFTEDPPDFTEREDLPFLVLPIKHSISSDLHISGSRCLRHQETSTSLPELCRSSGYSGDVGDILPLSGAPLPADICRKCDTLRAERMADVSGLVSGIASLAMDVRLGYRTARKLHDIFDDVVSQWTRRNFPFFFWHDRRQFAADSDELIDILTTKLLVCSVIEDVKTLLTSMLERDRQIADVITSVLDRTIPSLVRPVKFPQNEGQMRDLHDRFQKLLLLAWRDGHATTIIGDALFTKIKSLKYRDWPDLFKDMTPKTEAIGDDSSYHLLSFFLQKLCKSDSEKTPLGQNDQDPYFRLQSTLELCYLAIIILASLKLSETARQKVRYLFSVCAARLRRYPVSGTSKDDGGRRHRKIRSLAQYCLSVVERHSKSPGFASYALWKTSFSEKDNLFPDRLIEVLCELDTEPFLYKMVNPRVFRLVERYSDLKTTKCASATERWRIVVKKVVRLRRLGRGDGNALSLEWLSPKTLVSFQDAQKHIWRQNE